MPNYNLKRKFVLASKSDVAEVLTEIAKIDPKFDKVDWLRFCEKEIVPNILEACICGNLEVLQDWCYERVCCFFFKKTKNIY